VSLPRWNVSDWLARWSKNYALLRRAVDSAGRALAARPYESFLEPDEEFSFAEFVDGVEVHFGVEVYRLDRDGTLWVCVDADAALTTPLGIKPSFVFRKLPDGRAFLLK
jgi:hypothetical protein